MTGIAIFKNKLRTKNKPLMFLLIGLTCVFTIGILEIWYFPYTTSGSDFSASYLLPHFNIWETSLFSLEFDGIEYFLILLLGDIYASGAYEDYVYLRGDRKSWFYGNVAYIALMSILLIFTVVVASTIATTVKYGFLTANEWTQPVFHSEEMKNSFDYGSLSSWPWQDLGISPCSALFQSILIHFLYYMLVGLCMFAINLKTKSRCGSIVMVLTGIVSTIFSNLDLFAYKCFIPQTTCNFTGSYYALYLNYDTILPWRLFAAGYLVLWIIAAAVICGKIVRKKDFMIGQNES